MQSLTFTNTSPYDVFLAKNGLPASPDPGEIDLAYSRRLRDAVNALTNPVRRAGGRHVHRARPAFRLRTPGAPGPHDLSARAPAADARPRPPLPLDADRQLHRLSSGAELHRLLLPQHRGDPGPVRFPKRRRRLPAALHPGSRLSQRPLRRLPPADTAASSGDRSLQERVGRSRCLERLREPGHPGAAGDAQHPAESRRPRSRERAARAHRVLQDTDAARPGPVRPLPAHRAHAHARRGPRALRHDVGPATGWPRAQRVTRARGDLLCRGSGRGQGAGRRVPAVAERDYH